MEENQLKEIQWSESEKFSFRFIFIYVLVFCPIFLLYFIPGIEVITQGLTDLYHAMAVWFGRFFFGNEITVFTNGSGDTTYDFVLVICLLILSLIGALVWGLIDRKRTNYQRLYWWLEIIVRYYLVTVMFTYGFMKIIKTQFPFPSLNRLQQPYGDSSPMGLAWTFLGFSMGYNYFMGFLEVLTGVLLLFKRTTLLGALMAIAVSTSIAVMNFCFDIPVKLWSVQLILFGLFLIYRHVNPLFKFFIKNEYAIAPRSPSMIKSGNWKKVVVGLKIIVIGWLLYSNIYDNYTYHITEGGGTPNPPLYGIYTPETFVKNHDTLQPLTTSEIRWKTLTLDKYNSASVRIMNDTVKRFTYSTDTINKTLEFKLRSDLGKTFILNYEVLDEKLYLSGKYNYDSLKITAVKKNPGDYLLMNRGFHWINEYPLNR